MKMLLTAYLLFVLIPSANGQSPAPLAEREISAALGSRVLLPMEFSLRGDSSDLRGCDGFIWRKKNTSQSLLLVRSTQCREPGIRVPRVSVSENGSLEIPDATREDSGYYKVLVYDSQGIITHRTQYTLYIQVPVSDPVLNVSCGPNGSAEISCVAREGSEVMCSLSIKGITFRNYSYINISIMTSFPLEVTCSVGNRLGYRESRLRIESCTGPAWSGLCSLLPHLLSASAVFVLYTALLVTMVRNLRAMKRSPEPGELCH